MAQDGKLDLLRTVPLFQGLDASQLDRLAGLATEIRAADGEVLMRQGESGDEFFVVASGHVVVEREGQRLARLGPGEFLGEIALIDGRPRTATAIADGDTHLLVLGNSQFETVIEEFPGLGRQIARALVDRIRRTVTVPQFGIFAQGTNAHAFLEWDLRPGIDLHQAASVLGRLRGPSVAAGGVNLVLAFGSDLWRVLAPSDIPAGLGPFQPIGRLGGHHAPAAQHDLWLWVNGSSQDVVFEHTRAAAEAIETVAQLASERVAFVHRDSRDLTGFIDGTANPSLLEAPQAALVPDGQPGAGGSHVLAMRWVHDLDAFEALPTRDQEGIFGRTKADSVELADDAKPATAHIARVEIEDQAGVELPIYRRSVPYGTVAEHGLYFVAFAADRSRFDTMLGRMFGTGDDGLRDRLTDFTRPVSGAYYYAPPLNLLADLPLSAADEQRIAVPG
ncbi:MAG TPA: Dyp-type peroxidase [Candidatus Limnocylindrales bacterium]|nr:Dyp-type peroxidase [Candidatus Limnocylindrales bacterium]